MTAGRRAWALLMLLSGCPEPAKPEPPLTAKPLADAGVDPAATSSATVSLDEAFRPALAIPEVVARIAGVDITRVELEKQLERMKLQLKAVGTPKSLTREEVLASAIDQLVDAHVMKSLAAELGVKIDPAEVDAWAREIEQRAAEDETFRGVLVEAGLTPEVRRKDGEAILIERAILSKLKDQVAARSMPVLRAYYEEHKNDFVVRPGLELWRIRVKLPIDGTAEAKSTAERKAEELRQRVLKDPGAFVAIAKETSEGGRAAEGGYLGFLDPEIIPIDVKPSALSAAPGTILPLSKDDTGFSVFKVGASRKGRHQTFEEARDAIAAKVVGTQARKELKKERDRIKKAKKLEILVERR